MRFLKRIFGWLWRRPPVRASVTPASAEAPRRAPAPAARAKPPVASALARVRSALNALPTESGADAERRFDELARQLRELDLSPFRAPVIDQLVRRLARAPLQPDGMDAAIDLYCRYRRMQRRPGAQQDRVPAIAEVIVDLAKRGRRDLEAVRVYVEELATSGPGREREHDVLLHALEQACAVDSADAWRINTLAKQVGRLPEAASNLGRMALERERFATAQHEFEECRRLSAVRGRASSVSEIDQGLVHLGLGAFEQALDSFGKAARAQPERAAELRRLTLATQLTCSLENSAMPPALAREKLVEARTELAMAVSAPGREPHALSVGEALSLARRLGLPDGAERNLAAVTLPATWSPRLHAEITEFLAELGTEPELHDVAGAGQLHEIFALARRLLSLGRLERFRAFVGSRLEAPDAEARLLRADLWIRTGRAQDVPPALSVEVQDPVLACYAFELRMRRALAVREAQTVWRAIDLAPGLLLPRTLRALLRAQAAEILGLADDAVANLKTALAFAPRSSHVWTECGFVFLCLGMDADAESSFERAFELGPENVHATLGALLCPRLRARAAERYAALGPEAELHGPLLQRLQGAGRNDLCSVWSLSA